MKSLVNKINEQIINEYTLKDKDEIEPTVKNTWAYRKRSKHISSPESVRFKKFKKFFEDLKECAGLGVAIIEYNYNNWGKVITDLYYIREDEPNIRKSSDGRPKTYEYILYRLFDHEQYDIRSIKSIDERCYLALTNIDDDVDMLEQLKFKDVPREVYGTSGISTGDRFYQDKKQKTMFISFVDLYNNIDEIYKAFFEE